MNSMNMRGLLTSPCRTPQPISYEPVSPWRVTTLVVPRVLTSRAKAMYHSGIFTRRSASSWLQCGTLSYALDMSCSIVYATRLPRDRRASSMTSSRLSSGCSVPFPGMKAPCILPIISG